MSLSLHIPVLETNRLVLREPRLDDLAAMVAFYTSERSHMVGGPRDEAETFQILSARVGHWMFKGFGLWHLTRKSSNQFIGWVGMIEGVGWAEPELGWTVLAEAEGKGLAFEATSAARDYAASHQGLNRVISYIDPENTRSLNLAKRLGASYERDSILLGHSCQIWRHPEVDTRIKSAPSQYSRNTAAIQNAVGGSK